MIALQNCHQLKRAMFIFEAFNSLKARRCGFSKTTTNTTTNQNENESNDPHVGGTPDERRSRVWPKHQLPERL
jgi:hypothetical protein